MGLIFGPDLHSNFPDFFSVSFPDGWTSCFGLRGPRRDWDLYRNWLCVVTGDTSLFALVHYSEGETQRLDSEEKRWSLYPFHTSQRTLIRTFKRVRIRCVRKGLVDSYLVDPGSWNVSVWLKQKEGYSKESKTVLHRSAVGSGLLHTERS